MTTNNDTPPIFGDDTHDAPLRVDDELQDDLRLDGRRFGRV